MNKYLIALLMIIGIAKVGLAANGTVLVIDKIAPKNGAFVGVVDSSQTVTNTTNFNNNLSAADNTVQKALDTLDNLSVSGGGGGGSALEVFNNFNSTRSSPTASIGLSNAFSGSVTASTYTFALNSSSVTLYGPNIPANKISAGSLLSTVIASSIAASSVQDASIVSMAASKLTGTVPNASIDGSSVTKQGVLVAGTNITLTPAAGTLTISAASGGGGSSSLAVGTGTASNFTTNVTSPTAVISFLGTQFGSVASGTTNFMTIKNSGVTAGTYGSATQVSSVTIGADGRVTNAANVTISLTNSNLQAGTYSNVTVPAANVAAGSLGASVISSSIAVNAVQDASIVGVAGSKITGTASIPNAAINGSSITKAGVLIAGTNITLTPGSGSTTISASGGGSGSSIYPATSTALFPSGLHVSTISLTDAQGGSNKARVYYNDFGAGGSEIHLNMDTGAASPSEQLVIGSTNTSNKNIVFNGVNTGIAGFNDGNETLTWNKNLDVDQTLNVDGSVTFGPTQGFYFDSSVSSVSLLGDLGIKSSSPHLRITTVGAPNFTKDQIQFYSGPSGSESLGASIGYASSGSASVSSQSGITFTDTSGNTFAQFPRNGTSFNYFLTGVHNQGGNSFPIIHKTSDFSASVNTYFYNVDTTAGNVTMTFPALSGTANPTFTNLSYLVCKEDSTSNTVGFAATGDDSINTSITLSSELDCIVWTSSTSGSVGVWYPTIHSKPNAVTGGSGGTTIWSKLDGSALDNAVSTINVTAPLTASSSPSGQINIGVLSSSVTLQGNTFNTGSNLVQLSGGLIPNSLVNASSVTKQGVITAGTGISVTNGSGIVTIAATGGSSGITGSTTTISLTIDGQGSAIVAGSTRAVTVPYSCTISSWSVIGDASGSLAVHLATSTFNNYPTITNITGGGNGPSLSSQARRGAAVSGWTQTTIDAGSVLAFVVDSASTVKWATIVLWVIR